jgi:hypothetical protein
MVDSSDNNNNNINNNNNKLTTILLYSISKQYSDLQRILILGSRFGKVVRRKRCRTNRQASWIAMMMQAIARHWLNGYNNTNTLIRPTHSTQLKTLQTLFDVTNLFEEVTKAFSFAKAAFHENSGRVKSFLAILKN